MKHLATYANMGEAGFVQSMLESEGIDVRVNDPRNIIGGVQEVTLEVADEHYDRAREIVAPIAASHTAEAANTSDAMPAAHGNPSVGILSTCAGLGLLVGAAEIVLVDHAAVPALAYASRLVFASVVGASVGLVVGLFVCLLFLPVYRRLRRRRARRS